MYVDEESQWGKGRLKISHLLAAVQLCERARRKVERITTKTRASDEGGKQLQGDGALREQQVA